MDSIVAVNPLSVCVLMHGPDECPGPLSSLESVV